MSVVGVLTGLGIAASLVSMVVYILYRCRIRQEEDTLRISQYGGLYTMLGVFGLTGCVMALGRGETLWGIGFGLAGLLSLALRPLWMSSLIDARNCTISHQELRLWGKQRVEYSLADCSDLQTSEAGDMKGRRSMNIFLITSKNKRINLLVDQPSGSALFGKTGTGSTHNAVAEINDFLNGARQMMNSRGADIALQE